MADLKNVNLDNNSFDILNGDNIEIIEDVYSSIDISSAGAVYDKRFGLENGLYYVSASHGFIVNYDANIASASIGLGVELSIADMRQRLNYASVHGKLQPYNALTGEVVHVSCIANVQNGELFISTELPSSESDISSKVRRWLAYQIVKLR